MGRLRLRVRVTGWLAAVLLAPLMVAMPATPALASTSLPLTSWQVAAVPFPQGHTALVEDIACPSPGNCTAVGYDEAGEPIYLDETDGTWSSGVIPPVTGASGNSNRLGEVGCSSAGNCVAAGWPAVAVETNGVWSQVVPAGGGQFDTVGCEPGGACVVVGENNNNDAGHVFADTLSGGSWTSAVFGPTIGQDNVTFSQEACTDTACPAVGYEEPGPWLPIAVTGSGSSWSYVDPSLPSNAKPNNISAFGVVGCAASGYCAAVGTYELNSSTGGLVGDSIGSYATSQIDPSLPAGDNFLPQAVSCPTANGCAALALQSVNNPSGSEPAQSPPYLGVQSSGTWTPVSLTEPDPDTRATELACVPGTADCVAVGSYSQSGTTVPVWWSGSGTTWAGFDTPVNPSGQSGLPSVMTCDAGGTCTGVGVGDASGTTTATDFLIWTAQDAPLSVSITFPSVASGGSPTFRAGTSFPVEITVAASPASAVSGVSFTGNPLTLSPSDGIKVVKKPPIDQPFDLAAGGTKTFDYTLEGDEPAAVDVTSQVSGTEESSGQHLTANDRERFTISGSLVVDLTVDPGDIKVEQTADGAKPVTIHVHVKVTNRSASAVHDVKLDRKLGIAVLDHYHVAAIPIEQKGSADPSPSLGTINSKASKTATYTMEVSGDGKYELSVTATGQQAGARAVGIGTTEIDPTSPLLVWSAEIGRFVRSPQTPQLVTGGTAFTIRIKLENRSYTSAIVLAPMWPASMKGNATDGHVQANGLAIEGIDKAAPPPSPYEKLEPRQTRTVEMIVQTAKSDARFVPELAGKGATTSRGGTRAVVNLPEHWPGWVLSDADDTQIGRKLTADDEQTSPDSLEFTESIDDAPLDRTQLSKLDATYLAAGYTAQAVAYAIPDVVTGGWSLISGTLPQKLSAGFVGLSEMGEYEANLWKGMLADPAQRAELIQDVDKAITMSYQQVSDIPALEAQAQTLYANAGHVVLQHYTGLEQDLYDGDYNRAVQALSQEGVNAALSVPAVPEAGLGAALKMVNVTSVAAADLVRWDRATELLEAARGAVESSWADWLKTATSEAANPITDASNFKNFPRNFLGLPIDIGAVPELFGYSQKQMRSLLEFCKENETIVTIRGRSQAALDWINSAAGAAMKSEQFKMKTVDAIDEAYLGYAPPKGQQTLGSLVVRGPPSDAYVAARLRAARIPEGSPDWKAAFDRLAQRRKEFNAPAGQGKGYVKDMVKWNEEGTVTTRWNWIDNQIPKPNEETTVNFRLVSLDSGKPLPRGAQPAPNVNYAVEVQAQRSGAPWQRVTGDADMVSITNPDGSGLTEEQHVKLLNLLRNSDLGVEHPDLATWTKYDEENSFFFQAKKEQLESGTFLQACPDGTLRAVQYSPQLTNLLKANVDAYNYYIRFVGGCESPLASIGVNGVPVH